MFGTNVYLTTNIYVCISSASCGAYVNRITTYTYMYKEICSLELLFTCLGRSCEVRNGVAQNRKQWFHLEQYLLVCPKLDLGIKSMKLIGSTVIGFARL